MNTLTISILLLILILIIVFISMHTINVPSSGQAETVQSYFWRNNIYNVKDIFENQDLFDDFYAGLTDVDKVNKFLVVPQSLNNDAEINNALKSTVAGDIVFEKMRKQDSDPISILTQVYNSDKYTIKNNLIIPPYNSIKGIDKDNYVAVTTDTNVVLKLNGIDIKLSLDKVIYAEITYDKQYLLVGTEIGPYIYVISQNKPVLIDNPVTLKDRVRYDLVTGYYVTNNIYINTTIGLVMYVKGSLNFKPYTYYDYIPTTTASNDTILVYNNSLNPFKLFLKNLSSSETNTVDINTDITSGFISNLTFGRKSDIFCICHDKLFFIGETGTIIKTYITKIINNISSNFGVKNDWVSLVYKNDYIYACSYGEQKIYKFDYETGDNVMISVFINTPKIFVSSNYTSLGPDDITVLNPYINNFYVDNDGNIISGDRIIFNNDKSDIDKIISDDKYTVKLFNQGFLKIENSSSSYTSPFNDKYSTGDNSVILKKDENYLVSDNGRYLLVKKDNNYTIYVNSYNSSFFGKWCYGNCTDCRQSCVDSYKNYCTVVKTDPRCLCYDPENLARRVYTDITSFPIPVQLSLKEKAPCFNKYCKPEDTWLFKEKLKDDNTCQGNVTINVCSVSLTADGKSTIQTGGIVQSCDVNTDESCSDSSNCSVPFQCVNGKCKLPCVNDDICNTYTQNSKCNNGYCLGTLSPPQPPSGDGGSTPSPIPTTSIIIWSIVGICLLFFIFFLIYRHNINNVK